MTDEGKISAWDLLGIHPDAYNAHVPLADNYMMSREVLTELIAKVEATVRAEVAEEIAVKIEGWIAENQIYGADDAAKIARLAAGSSPDTTPEARDA